MRYCKTATTTEASAKTAPMTLRTMVIESVLSGEAGLVEAGFTLAGVTVRSSRILKRDIIGSLLLPFSLVLGKDMWDVSRKNNTLNANAVEKNQIRFLTDYAAYLFASSEHRLHIFGLRF